MCNVLLIVFLSPFRREKGRRRISRRRRRMCKTFEKTKKTKKTKDHVSKQAKTFGKNQENEENERFFQDQLLAASASGQKLILKKPFVFFVFLVLTEGFRLF